MRDQRIVMCLAWLALLLAAEVAWSQGSGGSVKLESVRIGFENNYSVGRWAPVWITLTAEQDVSGRLELLLVDGDGAPARYLSDDLLQLTAGVPTRLLRYVKPGRVQGTLGVRLVPDQGPATTHRVTLPEAANSTSGTILSLGRSVGAVDAVEKHVRLGMRSTPVVELREAAWLPDRWWGYDSIHTLILATGDRGLSEQLSPDQREAIRLWVRMGGRLVFSCGRQGESVLDSANPLADLAPGRFDRVYNQNQFGAIESFAGARQRLDAADKSAGLRAPMTLLTSIRGDSVVAETVQGKTYPMVIHSTSGFGRVVFVGFDLDDAPFRTWPDRARLVARLLESLWPQRDSADADRPSGKVLHEGYTDISGQLRGALERFPGVTKVSFSWIAGLICVYLLLIGPGDYLLMRRVFRRAHLTWITFPLTVVLFCWLAHLLSANLKGQHLRVNHVDIVDIDADSSFTRGASWTNIYAPQSSLFDLSLELVEQGRGGDRLLSWSGVPGNGFGGMNTRAKAAVIRDPYQIRSQAREANPQTCISIAQLPIPVASTKCLQARWWSNAKRPQPGRLTFDSYQLRGQIANPLPVALNQCVVYYRNSMYAFPGQWKAGQRQSVDDIRPRTLERHLTGRRVQLNQSRTSSTPWDVTSTDVSRILEIMMFYEAAGGKRYTRLTNDYLDFLDLTARIQHRQAILIGSSTQPAMRLLQEETAADAQEQHWTIYRIAIPVDDEEARSR